MTYITKQPVVFVGTGQDYYDLKRLNARSVIQALLKWKWSPHVSLKVFQISLGYVYFIQSWIRVAKSAEKHALRCWTSWMLVSIDLCCTRGRIQETVSWFSMRIPIKLWQQSLAVLFSETALVVGFLPKASPQYHSVQRQKHVWTLTFVAHMTAW